mgnify:CR=1 FL=1
MRINVVNSADEVRVWARLFEAVPFCGDCLAKGHLVLVHQFGTLLKEVWTVYLWQHLYLQYLLETVLFFDRSYCFSFSVT